MQLNGLVADPMKIHTFFLKNPNFSYTSKGYIFSRDWALLYPPEVKSDQYKPILVILPHCHCLIWPWTCVTILANETEEKSALKLLKRFLHS